MRFIDRRPILGQGPLTLMKRLGVEMDRMLEDFDLAHPSTFTPAPRSFEWLPAVELLQKPDQFVVKVELPGLTKEDVKIEVAEGYLTLEGERKQEKTEKREGFLRTERNYGTFFRACAAEGAKATRPRRPSRGILEIEVPIPSANGGSPPALIEKPRRRRRRWSVPRSDVTCVDTVRVLSADTPLVLGAKSLSRENITPCGRTHGGGPVPAAEWGAPWPPAGDVDSSEAWG